MESIDPRAAGLYGIKRSDGQWYVGIVDGKAVFGSSKVAGGYERKTQAKTRAKGLASTDAVFNYAVEKLP